MASRKFAAIRWSVALKRRNGMQDCKLSIIWNDEMKTACLGLRRVQNYAIGFHNFYKIVPLRSVPHNQAKLTVSSSCRRDDNRAVQGRVPFRIESAASGGKKTKNVSQKVIIGLQRYK